MSLSERQEKILNMLVREYIDHAEPISSNFLKEKCSLAVSPATIRNDLHELTEMGYITQPHTSAGRMPTNKAYKYFVDKLYKEEGQPQKEEDTFESFIYKEMKEAREKIDKELKLAQELTKSLSEISSTLRYTKLQNKSHILEILEILGPSRITYEKNVDLINKLLQDLQNF